jgi:hypothetical protein
MPPLCRPYRRSRAGRRGFAVLRAASPPPSPERRPWRRPPRPGSCPTGSEGPGLGAVGGEATPVRPTPLWRPAAAAPARGAVGAATALRGSGRRCRRRSTLIPTRWTHASGASMACTRGQCCKARVKASDVASRAASRSPVVTTSAASRRGWAARYHVSNEPQPDGVASTLGSNSGAMSPIRSHDPPGLFSATPSMAPSPALGDPGQLTRRCATRRPVPLAARS